MGRKWQNFYLYFLGGFLKRYFSLRKDVTTTTRAEMITLEREAPSKVSDHAYDLTRADLERLLWQDTEDSLQRPGWLTGQGNWAGSCYDGTEG